MKMFVSYLGAHEKVTSAEEDFNNQVQKMAHSVDSSQPFHQQLLSLSNGLMSQVALVAEMEVMCRFPNMNFH